MKKSILLKIVKQAVTTPIQVYICLFVFVASLDSCYAQKTTQVTDVTKQGVIPNDNKDDSKALQAILDKAAPGTTIFLPAGNYTWDGPVNILTNNITLKGEKDTRLVFTNKTDYYKQYNNQRVGMINIGANNVVIDNLYLDQNYRGSGRKCGDMPLISGIISGCSYLGKPIKTDNNTIRNCTVYDYYGDAISVFRSRTTNYSVINCTVISSFIAGNWDACEHKGEQGISVISGDGITITGNTIEGAIDDAIATHGNCSNVTITDNTITTIRGRILLNGITNGTVKNNKIEYLRNGWTAILITMTPDVKTVSTNNHLVVEGNTIHIKKGVTILAPIMLYAPGSDVEIINNTINSDDPQVTAGIQLAERRINKQTKTYYFGDNININKNSINNFSSGIKFNISNKVKEPKVDITDNNISNSKEKITRETAPFVLKVPDDNESN